MKPANPEKEYEFIKAEIRQALQVIDNSRNILYVAVGSILAFSLNQTEPFIALIPFVVIIPIYFITLDYDFAITKLGAYLQVFYEPDYFCWETRQYTLYEYYKPKTSRFKGVFHLPYIITGLGSLVIFAYLTANNHYRIISVDFISRSVCALILAIVLLGIWHKHRNSSSVQEDYLSKWKLLKLDEEQN